MGFIFWGVFAVYGLFVLGYLIWMFVTDKNSSSGRSE